MNEIKQLINAINEFRDERGWKPHHNPKDLAISLSIEAAELLEDFQWRSSEEAVEQNIENIKEEIADVFIYGLMLCSELDLDVETIIKDKIKKNGLKYPVSNS
ncbi:MULTISPECIES: nucleotide pyrophosphohydrolase [Fictibacillus]|jgi:DNA phosphorothioation-dependent restriction protein DptG|uniref:nucleotide pyrophosphohydrolase n=1 Tax=Fictibacillus TaxID=1329200 RepID=UPI0018CEF08A|nr:nucleotide pyrophosphohydrolase [Fictibacillus sp. 5RED26]MBH0158318.1 nucleotide pyrophosphohydrolase [Fictibacillus sp. 5RED26]